MLTWSVHALVVVATAGGAVATTDSGGSDPRNHSADDARPTNSKHEEERMAEDVATKSTASERLEPQGVVSEDLLARGQEYPSSQDPVSAWNAKSVDVNSNSNVERIAAATPANVGSNNDECGGKNCGSIGNINEDLQSSDSIGVNNDDEKAKARQEGGNDDISVLEININDKSMFERQDGVNNNLDRSTLETTVRHERVEDQLSGILGLLSGNPSSNEPSDEPGSSSPLVDGLLGSSMTVALQSEPHDGEYKSEADTFPLEFDSRERYFTIDDTSTPLASMGNVFATDPPKIYMALYNEDPNVGIDANGDAINAPIEPVSRETGPATGGMGRDTSTGTVTSAADRDASVESVTGRIDANGSTGGIETDGNVGGDFHQTLTEHNKYYDLRTEFIGKHAHVDLTNVDLSKVDLGRLKKRISDSILNIIKNAEVDIETVSTVKSPTDSATISNVVYSADAKTNPNQTTERNSAEKNSAPIVAADKTTRALANGTSTNRVKSCSSGDMNVNDSEVSATNSFLAGKASSKNAAQSFLTRSYRNFRGISNDVTHGKKTDAGNVSRQTARDCDRGISKARTNPFSQYDFHANGGASSFLDRCGPCNCLFDGPQATLAPGLDFSEISPGNINKISEKEFRLRSVYRELNYLADRLHVNRWAFQADVQSADPKFKAIPPKAEHWLRLAQIFLDYFDIISLDTISETEQSKLRTNLLSRIPHLAEVRDTSPNNNWHVCVIVSLTVPVAIGLIVLFLVLAVKNRVWCFKDLMDSDFVLQHEGIMTQKGKGLDDGHEEDVDLENRYE